jgi:hypothetical protein
MLMKTKEKAFARGRKKELGPRTGASDLAMSSIKMLKMKDDPAICMKKTSSHKMTGEKADVTA